MRFLRLPTDHQEDKPDKPDTSALDKFRSKPRRQVSRRPAKSEKAPTKRRGRRISWTRPTMGGGEE